MSPSTAQLELSLKQTLQTLSQILTFYSSVQSLSATPYASTAPRLLTDRLGKCAEDYQTACDELEAKVIRALAVLERDARKKVGLSPLGPPQMLDLSQLNTNTTGSFGESSLQNLTAFPDPTLPTSSSLANLGSGIGGIGMQASGSKVGAEDNMEDFLNDSLFGDSAVTSPVLTATDTSSLPIISSDLSALIASLGTKLPTASTSSSSGNIPALNDADAMAELLAQYNQNNPPLPSNNGDVLDYSALAGMDLDLDLSNLVGVDLSSLVGGAGGVAGDVMDYSLDMTDLPNLGAEELDDLLRRLDSAA